MVLIKRLLVLFGLLCVLAPYLSRGILIGGERIDRTLLFVLFLAGVIALVGAAIMHTIEKGRR